MSLIFEQKGVSNDIITFSRALLIRIAYYGMARLFPIIHPDIINGENASWDLALETPLKWTDSWDQASDEGLARWARYCELLALYEPEHPWSILADSGHDEKDEQTLSGKDQSTS